MTRITRWAPAVLLLAAGLASTARAQSSTWRLTATAGHTWFGGGIKDTTGGGFWGGPTSEIAWNLGVDRSAGAVRIGLGVSYVSSHLTVGDTVFSVTDPSVDMDQVVVSLVLRAPLLKVGTGGAALEAAVGPLVDFWSLTGEDGRSRFGGLGALEFSAPISEKVGLLATASGAFSGSYFTDDEIAIIGPDVEEATFWTWAFGLGVRYGL